eukprot:TRINITY_DN2779_c0_g1_i2.p1 TRINITY_DN2779_c0_g1~~TRINITY_DN2779_c0_g1_i2.p1  ORF type:complete len:862 (+),score=138.17 TRINITY_DN2779_c0_g1_i2:34-2586(+)
MTVSLPRQLRHGVAAKRGDRPLRTTRWLARGAGIIAVAVAVLEAVSRCPSQSSFTMSPRPGQLLRGSDSDMHFTRLRAQSEAVRGTVRGTVISHVPVSFEEGMSLKEAIDNEAALRFEDLQIRAASKNAILDLGFNEMTEIQVTAIPPALEGRDVMAWAQTGTGKTLAFAVPAVEAVLRQPKKRRTGVSVLVLEPTRELAKQTAAVIEKLLAPHSDLGVYCLYGETDIIQETEALQSGNINIIVSTPGRLFDHQQSTEGFVGLFSDLQMLVFDEVDRLMGPDLQQDTLKAIAFLPPKEARQTLMVSATFPKDFDYWASLLFRDDYLLVNNVKGKEVIPEHIEQRYLSLPQNQMADALWQLVDEEFERLGFNGKVLVFFPVSRLAQYYTEVFRSLGVKISEVHQKRAQSTRETYAARFWRSSNGIMFTTDVSARGIDYPNVSSVIHFAPHVGHNGYVHRCGRTGRVGKPGRSTVLLYDFQTETYLADLAAAGVRMPEKIEFEDLMRDKAPVPQKVHAPLEKLLVTQAYKAMLSYFWKERRANEWWHLDIVEFGRDFAESIGALGKDGSQPELKLKMAKKLGWRKIEGLNIVKQLDLGERGNYEIRHLKQRPDAANRPTPVRTQMRYNQALGGYRLVDPGGAQSEEPDESTQQNRPHWSEVGEELEELKFKEMQNAAAVDEPVESNPDRRLRFAAFDPNEPEAEPNQNSPPLRFGAWGKTTAKVEPTPEEKAKVEERRKQIDEKTIGLFGVNKERQLDVKWRQAKREREEKKRYDWYVQNHMRKAERAEIAREEAREEARSKKYSKKPSSDDQEAEDGVREDDPEVADARLAAFNALSKSNPLLASFANKDS